MGRLNYSYILNSELQTALFTRSRLKGANDNIPMILDTLFQLLYFTGEKKDVDASEGQYYSYCWHQYVQTPYSFRVCFMLYEIGHYLEATFVLRYLIEVLAKMRYLEKHKDLAHKIWTNKIIKILEKSGKKKKLTIKDIFEEVAPGYYNTNYGHLLSGFQHGGLGSTVFRIKYKSPTEGKIRMGALWDERGATYVLNNFIAICYGYLNYFPKFFSKGFKEIDKDLLKQYQKSMLWLKKAMDDHKKEYPRSIKWYKEMDPLIK